MSRMLVERYVKFFQTTSSIWPLQNLLGWRPHTSLNLSETRRGVCALRSPDRTLLADRRWPCRATAACVIPLLYLTSAYTPLHDTVHSHGLRNLEIIVFNRLEAAVNDELVSFVAADLLLWSSRSLISIKLLGFGFWFWWFSLWKLKRIGQWTWYT